MNLNDVSDYIYDDDLEVVSNDNPGIHGLHAHSKNTLNGRLNLQNKSINYRYEYSNFHDGYKNKGLNCNSEYPESKEGIAIDINNNMSYIYINNYTTLEVLHKFNLYETFPKIIYDPNLNEDGFIEREIYGLK